ncbi:hypothetical protein BJY04DRAFT_222641 [Aspergillus karnatakaensis]|uniref:fungal specific transcription factor domain-containing protein n=1 Tax=Aspergillus karnatakaensis TaxID=1810916 RepID=UPI003CCD4589
MTVRAGVRRRVSSNRCTHEVLEEKLVVQLDQTEADCPSTPHEEVEYKSSSPRRASSDDDDAPYEVSASISPVEIHLSSPHSHSHSHSNSNSNSSSGRQSISGPVQPIQYPLTRCKPDIIQADLDQLYFDRIHPIAPFLHQQRYFSWVEIESPSLGRLCLRSAIRTVAAAMSAQFRSLAGRLYNETLAFLQQLGTLERSPSIEQIQALLLLAHYEVLQMEASRAMVTAGRCFRLIQLSRLHDTDVRGSEATPSPSSPGLNEILIAAEERRRTFWVAYCFDRFLSSRNDWPLTLQEDMIHIRLPLPEPTFQTTTPSPPPQQPPTLLEALSTSSFHHLHSPFTETILLATLLGRSMTLRRQTLILAPTDAPSFWKRHKSLSALIEKRTQLLARNLPSPSALVDPMLAFTHFLARAVVIYTAEITQVVPWGGDEERVLGRAYVGRAIGAAREAARLGFAVRPVNCFKAHPFLPVAISRAAGFLAANTVVPEWEWGNQHLQGNREVEELMAVLRDLEAVNGLAREGLRELQARMNVDGNGTVARIGAGLEISSAPGRSFQGGLY